MTSNTEAQACEPEPIKRDHFHHSCVLPYGLTTDHLYRAMTDFVEFLGFINR
jgi:hypothetical protein